MKNQENTNICYVFSQTTLDLAINDWISEKKQKNPEGYENENDLIVIAAIPWFLKHLTQNPSLFMFPHEDLINGLEAWKTIQEVEFPHKKKLIKSTCAGIINFFESEIVNQHKMIIKT